MLPTMNAPAPVALMQTRRPEVRVQAEVVRALLAVDLAKFEDGLGSRAKPIAKIRASHHSLAMALAKGASPMEASFSTGYSPSRISVLQSDPTFRELVGYYKAQVEEQMVDVVRRLATLSADAVDELQSRLDERPEDIDNKTLLSIAEMALDRTGHAPQTRVQHQHVHMDVSAIQALKAAHKERGRVVATLPALPLEKTTTPGAPSSEEAPQ